MTSRLSPSILNAVSLQIAIGAKKASTFFAQSQPRVVLKFRVGAKIRHSVYVGHSPAALTPVAIPVTHTLPLADLDGVCCVRTTMNLYTQVD